MGDTRPLKSDPVVGDHVRAEIQPVELQILFAQDVGGQRLARLGHAAHLALKFGEHGLAVQRAFELIQKMVDQVGPLLFIGGLSQKMTHQEHLVAGGSHLGNKDHVIGGAHGLVSAAVPAVQGMAHLMGQGKHGVEIVLVVEQHVGMRAGGAGGIGSGALARVFVHIDPAVVKTLAQQVRVVFAQHGEGFQHGGLCLLVGDLLSRVGHDGGIHVVHVKLIDAQQPLAQRDIPVHFVHVAVDRVDQIVVHGFGDLGGVQRGGAGGRIAAGVGKEAQLLELGVQRGGGRVSELADPIVIGFKYLFAESGVRAFQQDREGAVGERVLPPRGVGNGRERQIRVAENSRDGVRRVGHLTCGRQKLLLLGREDVLPAPADPVQAAAVDLQLGDLGIKTVESLVGDGHDLGHGERGRALQGDGRAHGLPTQVLAQGIPHIGIGIAGGISVELFHAHSRFVFRAKPAEKIFSAAAQSSLKPRDLGTQRLQRLILRRPGGDGRKKVLQVPGEFLRNIFPGSIAYGHEICPPSAPDTRSGAAARLL